MRTAEGIVSRLSVVSGRQGFSIEVGSEAETSGKSGGEVSMTAKPTRKGDVDK
jgi:hypothetical protein